MNAVSDKFISAPIFCIVSDASFCKMITLGSESVRVQYELLGFDIHDRVCINTL